MIHPRFLARTLLSAVLGIAIASAAQAQSEETEINAFSVVRGKGLGFRIGEKASTYVGAFEGLLFVESSEGPVHAGSITCSASMEVQNEDRSQQGQGHCLITAEEGAQVFAEWNCKGYFMVGCSGTFTFTGGTERMAGITGGGPVTMRTTLGKLKDKTEVREAVEVEGIMFWRELKYKLP